ncbi:MAG TPA: protease inhibitor I42 family protein [Acidimicrobiia bacterium]|nr:protease inhibitor I42 family protein [Acidimicrobiia bacterium]
MPKPRAAVLLAATFVVLAAGLTACSGDDSGSGTSVTTYHQGDSITVDHGNEFVIALTANPSTGYSWSAGDNPNVKFVSSKQVTKAGSPPGAPGEQRLTFEAVDKGSSTLELAYARPFEAGVPPAKTASFPVTVR